MSRRVHELILLWASLLLPGVAGETMCAHSEPMMSPKVLTSVDYPAMVTASQCQCTLIPAGPISELDFQIQLSRSDQTAECSRTQMTIVHRNLSSTVCPSIEGDVVMESLLLTQSDKIVISLWNTHLEFLNYQLLITSENQAAYNVVCSNAQGSFYWPYDDQGLGYVDGIDAGIKVAVVVLFFILAVLTSAIIRLAMRLKARKARNESKKQQARQKRINHLKQVNAFENLGFSSSTLAQSASSSSLILHNIESSSSACSTCYYKLLHNGKVLDSSINPSTSQSNLGLNGAALRPITGRGCIWPLQNEGPYRPTVRAQMQKYRSNIAGEFFTNKTSKTSQTGCAKDTATENRQKPSPNYYQAPSTMSCSRPESVEDSRNRESYIHFESLAKTTPSSTKARSKENRAEHTRASPQSESASVHRQQPHSSWRKKQTSSHQAEARDIHAKNNAHHSMTIGNSQAPSNNIASKRQMSGGAFNSTVPETELGNATRNLNLAKKSRTARESEV